MAQGILSRNSCANFRAVAAFWLRYPTFGPVASLSGRHCLQRKPIRRDVQYSSSGRKIRSLPNNRTNEMIRGCEIRSISGRRTPPRPLYDDAVEHRLVVHGFRR